MSLRQLKWMTIFLITLVIGGFEFIRHTRLILNYVPMKTGNYLITILTFIIAFIFTTWLFSKVERITHTLNEERTKRALYEERERIAQDLHDKIAQVLFFLNVSLKKGKIEEANSAVLEIDTHLRQAIFNLRTTPDEGTSFSERLKKWLDEWKELTGISVHQILNVPKGYFTAYEEIQLFAIIQEAFTNIRKHSGATNVTIHFSMDNENWYLRIADNGSGITNDESKRQKYGLSIIKRRTQDISADFMMQSSKEEGLELLFKGAKTS